MSRYTKMYKNVKVKKERYILKLKKNIDWRKLKALESITNLTRLKKELFIEIFETEVYTVVERVMYTMRSGIGGS